jgi:hypothetical protein
MLKHIGGSQSEKLTAHQKRERSCRRDRFAGSLGAPFQHQGNVADRKNGSSNENNVVADVADEWDAARARRGASTPGWRAI